MKITTMMRRLSALPVFLAGGLLLAAACMSTSDIRNQDDISRPTKSGSELWAQNCRRCHNFRSPSEFSDSEWDVAMFHMRVRANLTAEEYELIRQFLKSSN